MLYKYLYLFLNLKKKIIGVIKIVIIIKLNANNPILFNNCKISVAQEKL